MIAELRDRNRLAGRPLRLGRRGRFGCFLRWFLMRVDPVRADEQERRQQDRDQRRRKYEVATKRGRTPSATPSPARMKENSPICARLAAIIRAVDFEWRNSRITQIGDGRFAGDDDEQRREQCDRMAQDHRRIEQHADRDEEQHRERIAQRQCFLRGALAQRGLAQDHAGEERPERERDVEQGCGPVGDARARSPAPASGTARATRYARRNAEATGITRRPTSHISTTKASELAERDGERQGDRRHVQRPPRPCDLGERRQEHQHQHHREVLDDQPADRDVAALGVEQAPLLQRAQHYYGAGDRQRDAEDQSGADVPAEQPRRAPCRAASRPRSARCTGHRDGADREQFMHARTAARRRTSAG